ncbi:MAG: PhoX family protein, partial [Ilumatobacteraceae bacterium]
MEEFSNHSDNETFENILNAQISRRQILIGGVATAALTFVGASSASAQPTRSSFARSVFGAKKGPEIGFKSIPLQTGPMPTIAPEYTMSVLAPWREKLDGSGTSFDYVGFTAAQQELSVGIGHDGMWYWGSETEGILCINHEYGTFPHMIGKAVPSTLEEVRLSQAGHGMSVIAIKKSGDQWKIAKSKKNRRITVNTPMSFSGPAATSSLLVNAANNPMLGTLNNCANGYTPWGTYLTCEENFNGYFGATNSTWKASTVQARYGVNATGFGYEWHKFDPRFDLSNAAYANEINR